MKNWLSTLITILFKDILELGCEKFTTAQDGYNFKDLGTLLKAGTLKTKFPCQLAFLLELLSKLIA